MAKLIEWKDIQPGTMIYRQTRPTGRMSDRIGVRAERYEVLRRTDDDRLEIVLWMDPVSEGWHGWLTDDPDARYWDDHPSWEEAESEWQTEKQS